MDYKIMQKDSFTVVGALKMFQYQNAHEEVPVFWKEHFASENGKNICGMYGINHDEAMAGDVFEYMIADNYDPTKEVPEGFVTKVIPAYTWAVFPCKAQCRTPCRQPTPKFSQNGFPRAGNMKSRLDTALSCMTMRRNMRME